MVFFGSVGATESLAWPTSVLRIAHLETDNEGFSTSTYDVPTENPAAVKTKWPGWWAPIRPNPEPFHDATRTSAVKGRAACEVGGLGEQEGVCFQFQKDQYTTGTKGLLREIIREQGRGPVNRTGVKKCRVNTRNKATNRPRTQTSGSWTFSLRVRFWSIFDLPSSRLRSWQQLFHVGSHPGVRVCECVCVVCIRPPPLTYWGITGKADGGRMGI